ncbi:MAG: hypothetical protein JXN10_07750 [Clostridia bacterium]|nr:hypothetical protein [Clostridia bacterium]MBN2883407.1 hypothetical protein [Clostridia bacterium]
MKILIEKEKLISQAPADIRDWGPWQFPRAFVAGPKTYLEFHISSDSALSYGKPRAWFCSEDMWETWHESNPCGMQISNGDIVKPYQPKALPESEIELPEVIGKFSSYGFARNYFDYEKVHHDYRHWYIERTKPGEAMQVDEVSIELPGYTMNTSEGVFPLPYFHQLKRGPGNSIWTFLYKHYVVDGKISKYGASWFHKSTDNGKTFKFISRIPYTYDLAMDPGAEKRYGYGEPDMCFIDENTAFSLHRTTDGTGIGPMYIAWTYDGGYTWTKPEYFDDRGVWPQTVALENGVVIAGYGRPGLFIRPYYNGEWHDRTAIVEPMDYQTDTCSYCAIIPAGPDSALIFYSDFNYPDDKGIPRKSLMVRKIRVVV